MIDIRPVLFVVGVLLTTLSSFMFVPALVEASAGSPDWRVFLAAASFTRNSRVGAPRPRLW